MDMENYSGYQKIVWVVMLGGWVVYMIMEKVKAIKVVGEYEDIGGKKFSIDMQGE